MTHTTGAESATTDETRAYSMPKLSQAQRRTLRTTAARGGLINGYAGQTGIYTLSLPALVRLDLLVPVPQCAACAQRWTGDRNMPCLVPLAGQKGGTSCYDRHQLTDAGRAIVAQIGA